jgi:predicted secreted protein
MAAVHGHSTTLAGSTAGTIGEITKLDVSGRKREMIDTSSCDSSLAFRTFIAGMADEGELSVDVVYDGTAAGVGQKLDSAFESKVVQTWTITWPDTSTFVCPGHITNLGTATTYEKEITQSLTIKLTGNATYTPSA